MPALPAPAVLILSLLLMFPFASRAQEPSSLTEPEQGTSPFAAYDEKLYLVEVIVFNNLGPIPAGGEIWHREPRIRFDPERYQRQPDPSVPGYPAAEEPVVEGPVEESPVEEDPILFTDLGNLAPHLSKLHVDPRYEVVTYSAWIQPLLEKRESFAVPIMRETGTSEATFVSYPPIRAPLSGSIRVFENKLLFVDVDVTNEFAEDFYGYSTNELPGRPPGKYSLQEKRRVKLNELHYFDHPFFGLLVRVSRYEREASASGG